MQVEVQSSDLARVAKELRRAGRKDVLKEASARARAELRPVVGELRAAIRATPGGTGDQRSARARQARPRGLRDAEARGVQIKVNLSGRDVGIRIRIDTRHFPDGEKQLARYREGELPRWRSPNWGRDEWKQQRAYPVFYPTIRPHVPRLRAGMRRLVDDLETELGGN